MCSGQWHDIVPSPLCLSSPTILLSARMAGTFRKAKTQFYALLCLLLFFLLFPPFLLICLPVYAFRYLLTIAARLLRPDLGKIIQTRSAVLATDNPASEPKWNLCVWITLEGTLDFAQFTTNFHRNIVLQRDSKGALLHPEFQQFFHKWMGFLFWKWEEEFSISQHMRQYFQENPHDKITDEEELRVIIKNLTAAPFAPQKSPWEFLFIPNFVEEGDEREAKGAKCVLIFRVHHGLCDGFTILWLLLKEVNQNGGWSRVARPVPVGKRKSPSLLRWIYEGSLRAPYHFMEQMVKGKDSNEWHLPMSTLTRPFNTSFTRPIPLRHIKAIKSRQGVTFTAVIFAALTGGLRKMMMDRGVRVPRKMSTAIPVPMPGHPQRLRNHFIFFIMNLPVGLESPRDRLEKVERAYLKMKASPAPLFSFTMLPIFGALSTKMMRLFSTNELTTVLTSNFPGPPEAGDFIGGGGRNRVLDMNFSAGMGVGSVGIGFCMMSYGEGMRLITSVDRSILSEPDVQLLNHYIIQELELLNNLPPKVQFQQV